MQYTCHRPSPLCAFPMGKDWPLVPDASARGSLADGAERFLGDDAGAGAFNSAGFGGVALATDGFVASIAGGDSVDDDEACCVARRCSSVRSSSADVRSPFRAAFFSASSASRDLSHLSRPDTSFLTAAAKYTKLSSREQEVTSGAWTHVVSKAQCGLPDGVATVPGHSRPCLRQRCTELRQRGRPPTALESHHLSRTSPTTP